MKRFIIKIDNYTTYVDDIELLREEADESKDYTDIVWLYAEFIAGVKQAEGKHSVSYKLVDRDSTIYDSLGEF